jgi:hypothetical protein
VRPPPSISGRELDLVCATIARPMQLVHFLGRRAQLNELGGRIASEELDWWMRYLDDGLGFGDDLGEFDQVRYLSQTDALDAWVLYERGLRRDPAPKPGQKLDAQSAKELDCLAGDRPPDWMADGCRLLDAADRTGT